MDFQELIYEARTCRRFDQSRPLTLEDLHWLVDCARVSPCARNAQVLRFALVHSLAMCARLFPHTRWAGAIKEWGGPEEGERPTGYIGIIIPKNAGVVVRYDVGIAAQSMQLAAASRGWGCCIHASFDRANCPQLLEISSDQEVALLLAFGVCKEERRLAPMPSDGSFAYWRDVAGVHFVPKRELRELISVEL